jgi:hypothetical protein
MFKPNNPGNRTDVQEEGNRTDAQRDPDRKE